MQSYDETTGKSYLEIKKELEVKNQKIQSLETTVADQDEKIKELEGIVQFIKIKVEQDGEKIKELETTIGNLKNLLNEKDENINRLKDDLALAEDTRANLLEGMKDILADMEKTKERFEKDL